MASPLRGFDAILLGAVGWPAEVPDSVSLHGLLLPFRAICQYPPAQTSAGRAGPLKAENFDIVCIRENTEGEYSGAGGRVHQGTMDEVAVETSIFTRSLAPGGLEGIRSGHESLSRWRLDQPTPMERVRILDPATDPATIRLTHGRALELLPALRDTRITASWAGYVDSTPDGVPGHW